MEYYRILKLTAFTGQNVCFQPVFEGNKSFASSKVYENSTEKSGTRVCDILKSLS